MSKLKMEGLLKKIHIKRSSIDSTTTRSTDEKTVKTKSEVITKTRLSISKKPGSASTLGSGLDGSKRIQPNQREIIRTERRQSCDSKIYSTIAVKAAPQGGKEKSLVPTTVKTTLRLQKAPRFPKLKPILDDPAASGQRRLSLPSPSSKSKANSDTSGVDGQRRRLLEHINACTILYDFTQFDYQAEDKLAKLEALNQIQTALVKKPALLIVDSDEKSKLRRELVDRILRNMFQMISINIFRELPQPERLEDPRGWNPEEDEPPVDPAWPHIEPVYNVLATLLNTNIVGADKIKAYINRQLIMHLVANMNSPEPPERLAIRLCLHRIYAAHKHHRRHILKAIAHVLLTSTTETEQIHGISELLEIVGCIVGGFRVPLKQTNRDFLLRVILPLHKCRFYLLFEKQLAYCCKKYVEKEPPLALHVMDALLRYWPHQKSAKEVAFLNELFAILKLTPPKLFAKRRTRVLKKLRACMVGLHVGLSQAAFALWNDEYFASLVVQDTAELLTIFVAALQRASAHHWSPVVRNMSKELLLILKEIDKKKFEKEVLKC